MVKNSKVLKLVVCMSLIVALAISALSLSVRASFENTHNNTGDQLNDIVGVATTQVGYGEGGDGYTKYGDWYGLPYSDWCAMFVSWCANQAGVSNDVFPSFALCSAGADWFINQGRFHYSGSYTPQAGDLIFYASYGNIYHVGLVTGSDGYNVYSIEGNYSEAVYNVSYPLSYGDIMGYASPAYSTSGVSAVVNNPTVEEPEDEPVVSSEEVTEPEVDAVVDEYTDDEDYFEDSEEQSDVAADSEKDTFEDTDSDEFTEEYITDDTDSETEVYVTDDTDESDSAVDSTDVDTESDSDTVADETSATLLGDVDGDGKITAADALYIQRYVAGAMNYKEVDMFVLINADVDASGEIDVADALRVLAMSIGA